MSTAKGGRRDPQVIAPGKKPKGSGKGVKGVKGRKPIAPVRVGKDRNWGPIALFAVVIVVAVGIIGVAFVAAQREAMPWQQRAASIDGVVNYRDLAPDTLSATHVAGPVEYPVAPPVGGNHNGVWQNCQGDVYTEEIPSEHAVHSLEHGAVWITYDPALDADQVERLASRVRGEDKIFMSPYPGLETPVSLQAWGYQLAVDDANDGRIDQFIRALKINASLEGPAARCDGGVTITGSTPLNLQTGE